ncbi:MAG: TIGR01777 family oxidoreductase, partial [Holophagales bacterium]|nr:TIGR01777 family oxidoreductase [Holophagales bacterium]
SELVFRVRQGPLALKWHARHEDVRDGHGFADVQVAGPFARWKHAHLLEGEGEACRLRDRIEYALPLQPLAGRLAGRKLRSDLEALFAYRHHTTLHDLRLHRRYDGGPWAVAITGSSGLLGSVLSSMLSTGGHRVVRVVRRRAASNDEVEWDGERFVEPERLEGLDAFVDLAGENVAGGRWTGSRRRRIEESRGPRVAKVVRALAELDEPPTAYLCASAIGVHGERGFLAGVARRWERAAERASSTVRGWGAREVRLRFGVVLDPRGGALGRIVGPFRLGAGAVPGPGDQVVSWISADDAVAAIFHALANEAVAGPVEVVAPEPVTMAELCAAVGRVMGRPVLGRVPSWLLRAALGEMAGETVFQSLRVEPLELLEQGFAHRDPELEACLRRLLGRGRYPAGGSVSAVNGTAAATPASTFTAENR